MVGGSPGTGPRVILAVTRRQPPAFPTVPPNSVIPPLAIDRRALREAEMSMEASPAALARPLVVLGGWRSPALQSRRLARELRRLTGANPADILAISYPFDWSINRITDRVAHRIHERWPGAEVDIAAISMGGLVARAAAMNRGNGRPGIRIRRLFTLATPHRGALLARWLRPDPAAGAMRPGSEFLRSLDAALPGSDYELVCYARLGDYWVGARNTSPPGRDPIWAPSSGLFSHFTVARDARIIADMARRLRAEPPLAGPPSPPPGN